MSTYQEHKPQIRQQRQSAQLRPTRTEKLECSHHYFCSLYSWKYNTHIIHMFSQIWFCLGWLKVMFFVPALCDIETIFCDHLIWNKVRAYFWMCHHGCWQSVINVALHAAATKAQKFKIRHIILFWCVIKCFYFMQNDWLHASASISTGAIMVVVDKPWNEVWWDSNNQTVCNHCQDTNGLQHLCPDTCRKMNVLIHRYSNSAAVWSEGCSPTIELTDGPDIE